MGAAEVAKQETKQGSKCSPTITEVQMEVDEAFPPSIFEKGFSFSFKTTNYEFRHASNYSDPEDNWYKAKQISNPEEEVPEKKENGEPNGEINNAEDEKKSSVVA